MLIVFLIFDIDLLVVIMVVSSSTKPILVRINGVLPEISKLGNENESERMAEVKRAGMTTNTSCSIFDNSRIADRPFQILVDIGEGVINSMENGIRDLGFNSHSKLSCVNIPMVNLPDLLLLTHPHIDHIKELPLLLSKASENRSIKLKIMCTQRCLDQITQIFPHISAADKMLFEAVTPGENYYVGPFSITPILTRHYDNDGSSSSSDSVIYIVRFTDKKIIIGWDFLSVDPNVDQKLFWNPDLLILGTETYNHHPETGMLSVTETYDLIRRWNAKNCYIVHYSGLKDFEEAKNQWFRGPTKAMTSEELQRTIDSHLQITGNNGKFKITVAKEGMIWKAAEQQEKEEVYDENMIGSVLEIEGLQKYVMRIEKVDEENILKLMIEDSINRYDLKFIKPRIDSENNNILYADGEKGMLAKGPELKIEIDDLQPSNGEFSQGLIRINVFKGKGKVFRDDIHVNTLDAQKLRRFVVKNFSV